MILTCPQCSTRYHVDAAAIGTAARTSVAPTVASAGASEPPADTPQVVEFGPPTLAAAPNIRPVAAPARAQNGTSASLFGWLVAVLVTLVLASAVIGRDEIVAQFPASARLYHNLHLPVTAELGLQFEGVTSARLEEGGIAVLVVEGAIVNPTRQERSVPPVRITLLDGGGRQVQEELFWAKEQHLEPGAKTSFSGRVVSPADSARNFSVTFEVDS